jgi:transglutaminase-like putative cysteine protease
MCKKLTKGSFIIFLLCLAPYFVSAQSREFKALKKKYPSDPAAITRLEKIITIDLIQDSVVVIVEEQEEKIHLNEQSKGLIEDKFYEFHFNEIISVEAKTLLPEGRSYQEIAVTEFQEKYEEQEGVFFDDTKSINFFYPGVQIGSKTFKRAKSRITRPEFLPSFSFVSYLPIEEARFLLKVDTLINIGYAEKNMLTADVVFSKTKKGRYNIYEWMARDCPILEFESNSPNYSYYVPHVIAWVRSYDSGTTEVPVLSSPADLYNLYGEFTGHLEDEYPDELKTLVDSLTRATTRDRDRARIVFNWVQENINYIAFEDGLRGFRPNKAEKTLNNRYGDCKDMACLTQSMLKLAGLESNLAWIGTRKIPYTYSEIPTPAVDNHMIATWENDEERVFLDATGKYTPFGLPSSMIQGKEALVGIDKERFDLALVPEINHTQNERRDSVMVTLNDRTVKGNGLVTFKGYERITPTAKLKDKTEEKRLKAATSLLNKGSNKFFLDSILINGLQNKDSILAIDYQFRVETYYSEVGDEIYLNLNLNKPLLREEIDLEKRKLPIELDHKYVRGNIVSVRVPSGYAVSEIPESLKIDKNLFGCSISYDLQGDIVTLKKEIAIKTLSLQPQYFEAWNNFVSELKKKYGEVIVLKKQS